MSSSWLMQPLALLLLTAAAITPILAAGVSPAISTACSGMTSDRHDYCASVLSSDPAAASANDTLRLGIIATNQIARNVTSTLRIISDLVRDLNSCTGYYVAMGDTVAAALEDLRAGRVDDAIDKLTFASGEPGNCYVVLSGEGVIGKVDRDPIRKENDENEELTQLAINFLNKLRDKRGQ